MSNEFTFGDDSDESSIFSKNIYEFGWPWPHRASDHSDTDIVTTARATGADKGNPTVHTHATRRRKKTREIRLWNTLWSKQIMLPFNAVRFVQIRGVTSWNGSMTNTSGWEARTDDASAAGICYRLGNLENWSRSWIFQLHRLWKRSQSWIFQLHRLWKRSQRWANHRLIGGISRISTLKKSKCFLDELVWNKPIDPIVCRLSDVLVKSTERCTCTFCFQLSLSCS